MNLTLLYLYTKALHVYTHIHTHTHTHTLTHTHTHTHTHTYSDTRHCGDNQEGPLISWLHYIYIIYICMYIYKSNIKHILYEMQILAVVLDCFSMSKKCLISLFLYPQTFPKVPSQSNKAWFTKWLTRCIAKELIPKGLTLE